MKNLLFSAVAAGLALPLAVLVTLLTSPFWRWFEEKTGIESFGHWGPAGWCYVTVYVVIGVATFTAWLVLRTRRPPGR